MYIGTYIPAYICICLHGEVGGSVFPGFALPVLEHCPAVPPISALILMLLGRKRKSGIAGSCRVMINLERISALPKACASNQCNVLELILLPTLPS